MFCNKCGTELPDDSQFCRKCGQSLTVGPTAQGPMGAAPSIPKPPHGSLRLLAVIGGALVLFLSGWFINSQWQKKTTPNQPTQSSATANAGGPANSPEQPAFPATSAPRPLSPQEIYQSESGGMALIETYDDDGRKRELGSGFVVSSDGTAITNYHVIRGAYRATVKFSDGTVGSVDV